MLKLRRPSAVLWIAGFGAFALGAAPLSVHASRGYDTAAGAGVCVFSGTATFSPAEKLVPASNIFINISGSGTCYGALIPVGESVTFIPAFTGTEPLASCEAGEGSLVGTVSDRKSVV